VRRLIMGAVNQRAIARMERDWSRWSTACSTAWRGATAST